jgi:hypothetical protein
MSAVSFGKYMIRLGTLSARALTCGLLLPFSALFPSHARLNSHNNDGAKSFPSSPMSLAGREES